MEVNVKVTGFPVLHEALRKKKEVQVETSGNKVADLIETLTQKYGRSIKLPLLDEKGQIPWDIRILKNGNEYPSDDRLNASLEDGDILYFMVPS